MELFNLKCCELRQRGAFFSIHVMLKLRISLFIAALNAIDQFDFLEQKLRLFRNIIHGSWSNFFCLGTDSVSR